VETLLSPTQKVKLEKKLLRCEKKYEKAEGKPLVQARIMKTAASVSARLWPEGSE
jgi:hypothetical protein